MAYYQFQYLDGQSAPHDSIPAGSDIEFYQKLDQFKKEKGVTEVWGVVCHIRESYPIALPQTLVA